MVLRLEDLLLCEAGLVGLGLGLWGWGLLAGLVTWSG